MPIYEYYSPDTHTIYSFWAKRVDQQHIIPKCPDGDGYHMEKVISSFSLTGLESKVEKGGDDSPEMMAAMQEMESALSAMDQNNPDSKQLGALMRKMSGITGEPLDGSMEEMVRKLEAGISPEVIEEEFGDVLADEMPDMETPDNGEVPIGLAGPGKDSALNILKQQFRAPRKDPNLYEYSD